MSRTFRRKGDKKRNKSGRSHFEKDYTVDRATSPIASWRYRNLPLISLEGKAFDKGYWKFHRDSGPGYGWGNSNYDRKRSETKCRMDNKQEIARYLKDEEYEVQAYYPGCLSWER